MFDRNESLREALQRNVRDALMEDIGRGDWTAQLVPAGQQGSGRVVAREAAVVCGRPWFDACLRALDARAELNWLVTEGQAVAAGTELVRIRAGARALQTAQGPALNFLQGLSGVATVTRRHVDAIAGLSPNPRGCAVVDTGKTLPGLRQAQRYAVRTGGGSNTRMALWDGILLGPGHIAAAGGVAAALQAAQALDAGVAIQVEVQTLDGLDEALAAGASRVRLVGFALADLTTAVARSAGRAVLEVPGSGDGDSLRDLARTGVDRISIDTLTTDVRAADLSLQGDAHGA